MKVFFGFFLHKKSTILSPPNLYKLYTLNSTLYLGVPAKPSGFPLYLCSLNWERDLEVRTESKLVPVPKSQSHFPKLVPRIARKGCRSNP